MSNGELSRKSLACPDATLAPGKDASSVELGKFRSELTQKLLCLFIITRGLMALSRIAANRLPALLSRLLAQTLPPPGGDAWVCRAISTSTGAGRHAARHLRGSGNLRPTNQGA
jgi:hypothetical protein